MLRSWYYILMFNYGLSTEFYALINKYLQSINWNLRILKMWIYKMYVSCKNVHIDIKWYLVDETNFYLNFIPFVVFMKV